MSQNPFSQKVKIYTFSAIALTGMAILLRICNFLLIYDPTVDYFDRHPLHLIFRALCVLTVAWLLTSIMFIPRYSFSTKVKIPASRATRLMGAVCACVAAASFFFFRENMFYYAAHAKLYHLLAIFSLLSTVYFALQFIDGVPQAISALSGYVVLLWLGIMLSVTYLNLYVPMNSPFKVTLHMALISIMLHVLEDARRQIGRHFRIAYLTYTLIAMLTCGIASFPVLVAYALGLYPNVDYLFYASLMLIFFLYLCVRAYDCYRALMVTPQATPEEIAEEEEKKRKEKEKKNKKKAPVQSEETKGDDTHVS